MRELSGTDAEKLYRELSAETVVALHRAYEWIWVLY
jgi:hypothetical protein